MFLINIEACSPPTCTSHVGVFTLYSYKTIQLKISRVDEQTQKQCKESFYNRFFAFVSDGKSEHGKAVEELGLTSGHTECPGNNMCGVCFLEIHVHDRFVTGLI